jgi:hypothetical protein
MSELRPTLFCPFLDRSADDQNLVEGSRKKVKTAIVNQRVSRHHCPMKLRRPKLLLSLCWFGP